MKPLAIDLYCGLGGWAEGFLAEGYAWYDWICRIQHAPSPKDSGRRSGKPRTVAGYGQHQDTLLVTACLLLRKAIHLRVLIASRGGLRTARFLRGYLSYTNATTSDASGLTTFSLARKPTTCGIAARRVAGSASHAINTENATLIPSSQMPKLPRCSKNSRMAGGQ